MSIYNLNQILSQSKNVSLGQVGNNLIAIQAMLEVSLKLQTEILAKLDNKEFSEVNEKVKNEVQSTAFEIFNSL